MRKAKSSSASAASAILVFSGVVLVVKYAWIFAAVAAGYAMFYLLSKYMRIRQAEIDTETAAYSIAAEEEDAENPEEEPEDIDEAFSGINLDTAIRQARRRLDLLYNRQDKYLWTYGTSEKRLEAFKKTITWRGLLWDIQDAEERLERLELARGE